MFRLSPLEEHAAREADKKDQDIHRPPILLQHGLLQTPITFVIGGKNSLAAILYQNGYDVWLGNNRGNLHSMEHSKFKPGRENAFWATSIDDYAHDMSTMSRAVLKVTESDVLGFIGHSQGSCQAMAALSQVMRVRVRVRIRVRVRVRVRFMRGYGGSIAGYGPRFKRITRRLTL